MKLERKHTSGEWTAKKGVVTRGKKGFVIAEVTTQDESMYVTKEESENNALIISASPEMFHALCEIYESSAVSGPLMELVIESLKKATAQ